MEFDRKIGVERLLQAQSKNPRQRGSGPPEQAPTQEDLDDDPWRGAGPGAAGAKYPLKDCALTPAEGARWRAVAPRTSKDGPRKCFKHNSWCGCAGCSYFHADFEAKSGMDLVVYLHCAKLGGCKWDENGNEAKPLTTPAEAQAYMKSLPERIAKKSARVLREAETLAKKKEAKAVKAAEAAAAATKAAAAKTKAAEKAEGEGWG